MINNFIPNKIVPPSYEGGLKGCNIIKVEIVRKIKSGVNQKWGFIISKVYKF